MKNNSSSHVEVKAEGSKRGADNMMKYDAVGNLILKILGGIGIVVSAIAVLIWRIAPNGFF